MEDAKVEELKRLYPDVPNKTISERLGVTLACVKNAAHRLGLRKTSESAYRNRAAGMGWHKVKTERRCFDCGATKPIDEYSRNRNQYGGGRNARCKACHSRYYKKYRAENRAKLTKAKAEYSRRVKTEGIVAYGGKCACCGEATPEFLTLDHVHGRTNEDRHKNGSGTKITGKSAWLKAKSSGWSKRFRVLCYNCNCARAACGVCPHEDF